MTNQTASELRSFLISSRKRLTPAEAGLPHIRDRRRSPGLRREEVAALANISVTWYAWFESGRVTTVSPECLLRIARALRLSQVETEYLFSLSRPDVKREPSLEFDCVPATLRTVVRDFRAGPAVMFTDKFDVICWNAMQARLFQLGDLPPDRLNILHSFFGTDRARAVLPNWQADALGITGTFRLLNSHKLQDPRVQELVAKIASLSSKFGDLWRARTLATIADRIEFFLPEVDATVEADVSMVSVERNPHCKILFHVLHDSSKAREFIELASE